MSKNVLQEKIQTKPISLKRRRIEIRSIVLDAFGVLVALQALTVAALRVVAIMYRRKRKNSQKPFPHQRSGLVSVGENVLQLYDYGRDLYDAMLAAIDGAQESIYLETYIWKGDEIGQAFKEHLARKAEQGVEVYAVFDSFANLVVPNDFKVFSPKMHVLKYQGIN